jgi:hypothetical protein
VIRFLIGLFFALWLIGVALAIVGAVVGGIYDIVTGGGKDPTPAVTAVSGVDATIGSLDAYISRAQRSFVGVAPHRGTPPVLRPPNVAMPCGIGLGDHVQFVACTDDFDLIGWGEQSDPRGVAKDCIGKTDAYSSGPHWNVCWMAPGNAWIDPFPKSPNPFVNPLGGALF